MMEPKSTALSSRAFLKFPFLGGNVRVLDMDVLGGDGRSRRW